MENNDLAKMIDHERWLLNNGLVSDSVKNQLFFCGSIVHKDVQAVELEIEPHARRVDYKIYVPASLLAKIECYNRLKQSSSVFGMWRFKRLLKREGCLEFHKILSSFVSDFCGPKWSATAAVLDYGMYTDKIELEDESRRDNPDNQSPDV